MRFYVATQLGSRHMKGTPLGQALSALSKALDLALDEGMLLSQARTEGEAWRTELGQHLQAATEDPRGKDKSIVIHRQGGLSAESTRRKSRTMVSSGSARAVECINTTLWATEGLAPTGPKPSVGEHITTQLLLGLTHPPGAQPPFSDGWGGGGVGTLTNSTSAHPPPFTSRTHGAANNQPMGQSALPCTGNTESWAMLDSGSPSVVNAHR